MLTDVNLTISMMEPIKQQHSEKILEFLVSNKQCIKAKQDEGQDNSPTGRNQCENHRELRGNLPQFVYLEPFILLVLLTKFYSLIVFI